MAQFDLVMQWVNYLKYVNSACTSFKQNNAES